MLLRSLITVCLTLSLSHLLAETKDSERFRLAIDYHHIEEVRGLLNFGFNANMKLAYAVYGGKPFFCLPLNEAVTADDLPMVKLLIAHGADPALAERYGLSSLELCASVPVAAELIQHGADVNRISGDTNNTPLLQAIRMGRDPLAKYFLNSFKMDINHRDTYGYNAYDLAYIRNKNSLLEMLKKQGVEIKDTLVLEVSSGHLDNVAKLLKVGWNPNAMDHDDFPLPAAMSEGSVPIAKLLIKWGAKVNSDIYKETGTPLIKAVEFAMLNGNMDCINLLIKNHAGFESASEI